MPEPIDTLLSTLHGQPPPAPFVPASAVRRRGRQRRHRQAVSAGVAVLAVTGLGAGGVATMLAPPEPESPPPPASPGVGTQAPGRILPGWLLTADDLGPGTWVRPERDLLELENGPWIWLQRCASDRDFDVAAQEFPSLRARLDLKVGSWEDRDRDPAAPGWRVNYTVELFAPGVADAYLGEVGTVVADCVDPAAWRVIDQDIAGDQALLVEEAFDEGGGIYYAVVRVADAVTTVMSTDRALVEEVAPRAAARLQ